jgi:hypothetical protein
VKNIITAFASDDGLSALSYASQPHRSLYPAANRVVLSAEDMREKQGR